MEHERLFELASPYLERNDFGVAHTQRVLAIAREHFDIPEKIRRQAYALIILHDVGGSSVGDQYEKGPEIAARLLRQVGHDDDFIDTICEDIRRHHARIENPSEVFKILYDADHLVMLSREEFPYYGSRPNFNPEIVIDRLYYDRSKELARTMLSQRMQDG